MVMAIRATTLSNTLLLSPKINIHHTLTQKHEKNTLYYPVSYRDYF
jgi:hypothetical protein